MEGHLRTGKGAMADWFNTYGAALERWRKNGNLIPADEDSGGEVIHHLGTEDRRLAEALVRTGDDIVHYVSSCGIRTGPLHSIGQLAASVDDLRLSIPGNDNPVWDGYSRIGYAGRATAAANPEDVLAVISSAMGESNAGNPLSMNRQARIQRRYGEAEQLSGKIMSGKLEGVELRRACNMLLDVIGPGETDYVLDCVAIGKGQREQKSGR